VQFGRAGHKVEALTRVLEPMQAEAASLRERVAELEALLEERDSAKDGGSTAARICECPGSTP
jgi:hypothetical protein